MQKLRAKYGVYVLSALLLLGVVMLIPLVGLGTPGLWPVILVALALVIFGGRRRCEGFLSWKPEYSVGIASIDDQHIKLLNLINNLRTAVLCDTGPDFERGALEELVAYTQDHLKYEEDLMRARGYFDFEAHKGQHDQMIVQVETYVQRYTERGTAVLPEVADYLQRWLLQHIKVTDRKLCDFLKDEGIG